MRASSPPLGSTSGSSALSARVVTMAVIVPCGRPLPAPTDEPFGVATYAQVTPMNLAGLLDAVAADPALAFARAAVGTATVDLSAPPSMRPLVVATLAADEPRGRGRFVLAVTATSREAADLVSQLRSFLPE